MVSSFRRSSTAPDMSSSSTDGSRRPSVTDSPRKSSLVGLSLRLTRSKKTNASQTAIDERDSQLGQLFFSLPCEIQAQVLGYLDVEELFALRSSCRGGVHVLHSNASALGRTILDESAGSHIRPYIQFLYPQPVPCTNTNYILQTLHRRNVVERMVQTIVVFIQMKIYMIKTTPRIEQFGVYRERLQSKLYRPAWTLHHFFESYRNLIIYEHSTHAQSRFWDCTQCSKAVQDLVNSYPAEEVVPAYQLYQLSLLHLKASSRAPSYAGTIERRLRGWSHKPPTEDELSQVMILGGMPLISRISMMKGTYNQRLVTIGDFVDKLAAGATQFRIAFGGDGSRLQKVESSFRHDVKYKVDTPYQDISDAVIEGLPALNDFFLPEWSKRIMDEELVSHERELSSPFGYVQRIMAADQGRLVDDEEDEVRQEPQPWHSYIPTNYG